MALVYETHHINNFTVSSNEIEIPRAIKLSYICEPCGIGKEIAITFNNKITNTFVIGKTGMFEIQAELFDLNNDPEFSRITKVKVPEGIKFKLDYITIKT